MKFKPQLQEIISEEELGLIDIIECNEPLVRLIDIIPDAVISMTEERKRESDETLYLRRGAAKALFIVSDLVKEKDYKMRIFDGFRPIECQQKLYDSVCERLKAEEPNLTDEELLKKAFLYVFPPSWDKKRPPAHSTGGAVDITLSTYSGYELDMGTKYCEFDNPLIYTNANGLTALQKENRMFLVSSMAKAGFVNFPGEWWHYSIGDREYAAYRREKVAKYGRANDPYKI